VEEKTQEITRTGSQVVVQKLEGIKSPGAGGAENSLFEAVHNVALSL